jgi:exonuclease SbcD
MKSVTVVELGDKKDGVCRVHLRTPELVPLRDMKVIKGNFDELTDKNYYKHVNKNDYMRIILTDEEDVIGALGILRAIYPNIMRLEYDNTRTRAAAIVPDAEGNDGRTPLEIFAGLYEAQNGKTMDEEQTGLVSNLIEEVWGEEQ